MTTISKRDALQLAADIRSARIGGYAIAERTRSGHDGAVYGFLGGLESVLRNFVAKHAGTDAGAAIDAAMNHEPTADEIAARNAELARWLKPSQGAPV